jgi:sulfofructose kinase
MVRSGSNKKIEYDCVGLGVNAVDYLCILDPYPRLDEKVDVVRSSVQGGGPVPTAMVTLAKLGAKVCYIGKIGNDPEGDFVKSQLEKEGVDTRYLLRNKSTNTSRAFIWVDKRSGKRTVALDRDKDNHIKKGELKLLGLISTRLLHMDAREPDINILAARWAKKQNAEVCLDVGSLRRGVEKVFPHVDHLIVSKRFACGFVQTSDPSVACRELLTNGLQTVVVTIGEAGCICGAGDKIFHSPGFRVKAVDTTGAGDVFHGAFIYGLLKKWPLKRIARFANACAAIKCRRLGGRAGVPVLQQVEGFMKNFKRRG